MWGNTDSGIQKMLLVKTGMWRSFACGIWNPGLSSSRNLTNDATPESKFHWQRIQNPRLGIQNPRLSWILLYGAIHFKTMPNVSCHSGQSLPESERNVNHLHNQSLFVISMLCKTEWTWELNARSTKMSLIDITTNSPHYFYWKSIGQ